MTVPTFDQVEAALDDGRLLMMRPQGDFVRTRRRGPTEYRDKARTDRRIPVFMENMVEANITRADEAHGFSFLKIEKAAP